MMISNYRAGKVINCSLVIKPFALVGMSADSVSFFVSLQILGNIYFIYRRDPVGQQLLESLKFEIYAAFF